MEEGKRFGRSLGAGGGGKVAKNRLPGRLEKGLNSLVRGPSKRGGGALVRRGEADGVVPESGRD